LLHKQAVVDHGTLTGLRFGTPRSTSGALSNKDDSTSPACGWLDAQAANATRDWLDQLHDRFRVTVSDQLQSVKLTGELLERWPQRYSELKNRAAEIRRETTNLQTQAQAAEANPLRHVDELERLPGDIARIRADLAALGREVEALPDLADADRRAIVAARQHDEQFIRDQLHFDSIDSSTLTAYLLQEQLTGPVGELMGWVAWVRQIVPATEKPGEPKRYRGQDIYFAACEPRPDLLIRALDLRGSGRIAGQPFDLCGTLSDFSSKPALWPQPIRLRLATTGSLQIQLHAVIDRTGAVAKDQFLVDCGGIVLPKFRLGGSDKMRLSIAPSTATLNVSITVEGNKLSGDIQLVQKQVEITPSIGEELAILPVEHALEQSLRSINFVATRVSLSGTLDRPQLELWSNLGAAVSEAMNGSIQDASTAYARAAITASQQHIDEQLAQLDRQIVDEQTSLKPQLAASTDVLRRLMGSDGKNRLSMNEVGRQLPADALVK
jgi:uncharacterized protein (TIGR03545 family)